MKKNDDEKNLINNVKEKILEFLSKYSAYGVFAVVLIITAIITIISLPKKDNSVATTPTPKPSEMISVIPSPSQAPLPSHTAPATSQPNIPSPSPSIPVYPSVEPTPTAAPSETPGGNIGDDPSQGVVGGNENKFSIALPFDKKSIITKFSDSELTYSETLDEWSCHAALDFACNKGDEVKSAANGIVVRVENDGVHRVSILVCHENDFYTFYSGLESASVKADELIAQGQVIGTAAENIPFEEHMPTHIHFELIKDNYRIDPLSFSK